MQTSTQPKYFDLKDEKQINSIIKDYEYVVKIYINKYKIPPKDFDDAMQEGRLGILKAIKSYEAGRGASFNSFASLCIERQLLSYLRGKKRLKNKVLEECTTIEMVTEHKGYCRSEIEDYVLSKLHILNIYSSSISELSREEKEIFQSYIKGFSVNEISEEYQLPKRSVYKIISDAKKMLEEKLNKY